MELRHYLAILRRRWPIIVILPLLVALVSGATALTQPQRYGLTARLMVTQTPLATGEASPSPDLNSVGSWQASEYVLDDLPQVLSSALFAQDVSAALAQQGLEVSPATLQSAISGVTTHRTVDMAVVADDPQLAVSIARAAAETLRLNGLKYWNRQGTLTDPGLRVAVLTMPESAGPIVNLRRIVRDVALRTVLALAAGIGLAFLMHYLDRTLRDRQQVEALLDVPVVGAIPPEPTRIRKR